MGMSIGDSQYALQLISINLQIIFLAVALILLYYVYQNQFCLRIKKYYYGKQENVGVKDDIESAKLLPRKETMIKLTTMDPLILKIHDSAII